MYVHRSVHRDSQVYVHTGVYTEIVRCMYTGLYIDSQVYIHRSVHRDSQVCILVLSLATANKHRISPTLADRVPTYVDFINSPQNETIQLICTVILFSHLYTPFTMSYLYFGCLCIVKNYLHFAVTAARRQHLAGTTHRHIKLTAYIKLTFLYQSFILNFF